MTCSSGRLIFDLLEMHMNSDAIRQQAVAAERKYVSNPTFRCVPVLGFGVPSFNTFFLKGTIMK